MEQWKIIEGTRNRCQISNLGHFKFDDNLVEPSKDKTGYMKISIKMPIGTRWFWIHRIVAYYFCEGYFDEGQVNHIDGNKENNSYENLEWVTNSENQRHRIEVLGHDNRGITNPMYGICGKDSPVFAGYIYQIEKSTGKILAIYEGSGDVVRKNPEFKRSGMLKVLDHPTRTYKGFVWKRDSMKA